MAAVAAATHSRGLLVCCMLVCLLVGWKVTEAVEDTPENDRANTRFPISPQFATVEMDMSTNEDGTCLTERQKKVARQLISNGIQQQLVGLQDDLLPCNEKRIGHVQHCAVENCSVLFQQEQEPTKSSIFIRFSGLYWLQLPGQEPEQVYCSRETGYPEVASCSLLFAYHSSAESGYYTLLLEDGVRLERVYCNKDTGQPEPKSCGQAYQLEMPSGDYILRPPPFHSPLNHTVFCDMNHEECGTDTQWWTQIASFNMSDTNTSCPPNWELVEASPIRGCSRRATTTYGCDSVRFSVFRHSYTKVCGKVVGHQSGRGFGFWPLLGQEQDSVDKTYLTGVSITHGSSPRTHIWSFATVLGDLYCPCAPEYESSVETLMGNDSFVGSNYFCEMGDQGESPESGTFDHDYPLWDGTTCGRRDPCCKTNNPPWFTRDLPQPTTDDIEVRICGINPIGESSNPISQMEIFIH